MFFRVFSVFFFFFHLSVEHSLGVFKLNFIMKKPTQKPFGWLQDLQDSLGFSSVHFN